MVKMMHTTATAAESLEFLWSNYLTLVGHVDLEAMSSDVLEGHIKSNATVRPFRIATWFAREGGFFSIWSFWEYHARIVCGGLPNRETKAGNESTVDWVARSLAANGISFGDRDWFNRANVLRNLIAHGGGRITDEAERKKFERCQLAFPSIGTWQDGYIAIEHEHLAELYLKVEDFIRDVAR